MRSGRALCIGVDRTERSRSPAETDACALARIAGTRGFELTTVLLGSAAVKASVLTHLRDAASECQPGDLFLLTFSGHGGRGSRGSSWTVFDGVLEDEEMRSALAEFRPGVRVVVISDSCEGGVPADRSQVHRNTNEVPDEDPDEDPDEEVGVAASVLVFSACRPGQYADGVGHPGHFTTALLRAWNSGQDSPSYRRFYDAIVAAMPEYQQPNYYWVGSRDPDFESQAAFTV